MTIETTEHFIIVQLENGDFKWAWHDSIKDNVQPYRQALYELKTDIPEQDRFYDDHHKVWMITNTPEYLATAQRIKQELERDLSENPKTT